MSVYSKENPEYLKQSLNSIINQTVKPDEIVVVKDGPLTSELENVIEKYKNTFKNLFKIVDIKENVGLGLALREGVLNCSNEIIARMDTDDICIPERFEKQIKFLENNPDIDIVGSWISEFKNSPENIYAQRIVPLSHNKIHEFAKWRNPMNHMTVMFRKQSVIDAGNYEHFQSFEDYYLWVRMLNKGCKFANIEESLVKARAGELMFKKRAGLKYFLENEFLIQKTLLDMNFINEHHFLRNVTLKFLLRVIPANIMAYAYNGFLRKEVKSN